MYHQLIRLKIHIFSFYMLIFFINSFACFFILSFLNLLLHLIDNRSVVLIITFVILVSLYCLLNKLIHFSFYLIGRLHFMSFGLCRNLDILLSLLKLASLN